MNVPLTLLVVACAGAVGVTAGVDRYHQELNAEGTSRNSDAFNTDENSPRYWTENAQASIEQRLRYYANSNTARNVVLFLGDGMSVPTLAAARALLGQRQGRTGEEAQLSFEAFPTVGLVKTYCLDAQVADSACSATAYLSGVKANSGTLGVSGAVPRRDCEASLDPDTHLQSIADWALADGRDAGIVTTTRITHASPAGVYANSANRNWESDADVVSAGHDPALCPDIAMQLIHSAPGNQLKVILGGGRREFLPNTTVDEQGTQGNRADGRNLIEEWIESKESSGASHAYVWNRDQLMEQYTDPPEYLLGLFQSSHLNYHLQANESTQPTLAELTEVAIRSLNRNENGFFLFVEGGRIDHAHHNNYVQLALDETIEFSKAIERANELLSEEDSLLVVTSDHAHVMAYNGYRVRGGDILGPSGQLGRDDVPYMTLSYTNGPGHRSHVDGSRVDVTQDVNFGAINWSSHADVPLSSETHGGDDVGVFARGPHQHLFTGLYEQSHIPHLLAYAACFGPGLHACSTAPAPDVPYNDAPPLIHYSLATMLTLTLLITHAMHLT